jgi:cell division protein ZipA
MSELRWTLLILGVVFIAALTWWERRRPRQAFAPRPRDGTAHAESHPAAAGPAPAAEPWIGESALSDVVAAEMTLAGEAPSEAQAPGPLEELPTLVVSDPEERLALEAAWNEAPPEPMLIDPASIADADTDAEPEPHGEPEIAGAEGIGAVRTVEPAAPPAPACEPIVEWPPEESRRILALRLVAPAAERFPGRALRLALAAEGFLLGKFAIFHKPDETNRAVLSAASLTQPGAFDLETMDSQRYGGLSLFAVLPGPKSAPQAFEDLLAAARNLNERLQGALQDERGGPLTPLRVASLRESLRAEAPTVSAARANEA